MVKGYRFKIPIDISQICYAAVFPTKKDFSDWTKKSVGKNPYENPFGIEAYRTVSEDDKSIYDYAYEDQQHIKNNMKKIR